MTGQGRSPAEVTPGRAPRRSPGRNLPVAIASGVILAIAFIGTLFWSAYAFLAFLWLLVVGALFELDVAFRSRDWRPATPVAVGVSLVLLFGSYANGPQAQTLGLVLLVFGAIAWSLLAPRPPGPAIPPVRTTRQPSGTAATLGATFLATLWVPFLASFAGLLLARPDGQWLVLATVALTVASDIGAFAAGSRFGRHRMAPSVSPAKTWEGFVGGLLVVAIVAVLGIAQMPGLDVTLALALGAAVVVAATVGDLAESLVKRDFGLKDLGTIVPGHGGIMDRADAVLFALPAAYLLLAVLGE